MSVSEKKTKLLLGGHMSIAGGLHKAFARGESINCNAMQIFTKNNRQWQAKPLTQDNINTFKTAAKNSTIKHIVVHASYLINIGSPDSIMAQKSTHALAQELQRCEQLGIKYLILHPGSHLKSEENICLDQIASNIDAVLGKLPGKSMILIENMAGQGSNVGYTFKQLATIYKQIKKKKRVGFCFDTCHAFAAGYDFQSLATYKAMWKEWDRLIGIKKIKAIHINDSKKTLASRVDRHEFIGKGKLGKEAFKLLCNDPCFFDIPKILETPIDIERDYIKDMKLIVNLITRQNSNLLTNTPLEKYKK